MKKRIFTNMLAVLLCAALLIACLPLTAFADAIDTDVQMVEGDVTVGFVPAGTACTSADPSIAWVDESGNLNAMKVGTTTVSDGQTEYTVTVSDYEDGSEVVGNLKILARYNDSMQFYDGHVYLLFTSYQDGVTVTVPDLYAAYEIDDQYYEDIRKDISYGSNHTGKDASEYFRESYDVNSVTLDRGEIVTIGMYRGFDLSVPQTALGSIRNSSLWNEMTDAGKAAIIKVLFDFLDKGKMDPEEALARFKTVLDQEGLDYNKLLDGVVDGGVCFNRELYNQKLEWDQYENVTYEMEITRNQLDTMMLYLGGNKGNFSILKNSCATVALRAWNAAVGTRNGEKTAYYLTTTGEGIFSIVDAPKTVRDSIVNRLPGYYLNNADGVAEPNAGYQDETGWVYVSAPEKVAPVTYVYEDGSFTIDEESFKISTLINAAKGEQRLTYNKDAQEVGINVKSETAEGWTTISGIDFTVNGTTVSLTGDNIPEDGVQFVIPYDEPAENEYYRLLNQDGEDISGYYSEGNLFVYTDSFPITYRVTSEPYEDEPAGIEVSINGADDTDIVTEVYYKNGDEKVVVEGRAYLDAGTKVYVKTNIPEDDTAHVLSEIRLLDENVMNGDHYDSDELAYFVIVPDEFAGLSIYYEEAAVSLNGENTVQIKVGDTLDVKDCAVLKYTNFDEEDDNIVWETVYDPFDGAVEIDGGVLTGKKQGVVIVKACAAENTNICALVNVEVYDSFDDMCVITADSGMNTDYQVCYTVGDIDQIFTLPFSGYRVNKGAVMIVKPIQESSKALRSVKINRKAIKAGGSFTATEDTEIKVEFADAKIANLPKSVKLAAKEDTYQLEAQVKYTGLLQLLPVYDSSVTYRSSDPLVAVDENGLISVAGDLPDGGAIAYVTAYAGSSNDKVSAVCKVIVGDYQGDRIVGSLTVSARPIVQSQLVSHAMITFTTYEDVDLDVSYYEYDKPNEKFYALMQDYADHPEDYASDPVLYNDNELGLEDRNSYFDVLTEGPYAEPNTISLNRGESITMSNYGYEPSNFVVVMKAFENGMLYAYSPQVQELVQYMKLYQAGEEFDAPAAFDDLIASLGQIYGMSITTGINPANGVSNGGLMINKEAYNQFRRDDSQMPNHYYTVDITADELALLKAYLADPNNNTYSLMTMSCATGTVNIWNTTLADRPEHQIKGNFTGVANDPMSIYYEVGLLRYTNGLDGKGGDDFYPRIVVLEPSENPEPEDPTEPENPDKPEDPDEPYMPELRAWYMLGDADGDEEVTIIDATMIQRYLASMISEDYIDPAAAAVSGDGVNIIDVTFIQRYLASIETPLPIGELFHRETGDSVETVEETVIADTSGVKVTLKSFGREYTPYLILNIENSGEKDADVSFNPITVNGFQTQADFAVENEDGEDYSISMTVPAKSNADYKLVFNGSNMDYPHMSEIAQIGFVTCVSDSETYQLISSQKAAVNTSAYGSFDYRYDETGEAVYDNHGIKLIYNGLADDGMITPLFYINNQSDKDIHIRVKEFKRNGKDAEGVFGAEVFSGCRAINSIGFLDEVDPGDTIQVTFEICERGENGGDGSVLYTTDAFSFTV